MKAKGGNKKKGEIILAVYPRTITMESGMEEGREKEGLSH